MKFELVISERGLPGTPARPRRRMGVMVDGRARFPGERVSVDWAFARQLIAAGQATVAPGVTVPLAMPERKS